MLHIKPESTFGNDIPAADYDVIRKVIEHISLDYREQPSLDALADETGLEATALQKLFTRWAGLSPKAFLQAVTMDHARRLLDDGMPLLEASYEVGLSGPSRLHDLFVTHEAMSPGDFKTRGGGLTIRYGFHPSPFGHALVMATERGICGLAFADAAGEAAALADMTRRWPQAAYIRDDAGTSGDAARVFEPGRWRADRPLRIVLIGTDFQVRVWQRLLDVPMGRATTYGKLAAAVGSPKASRAVGAAVGANPISFVVPCHRAVGATGALTGYHWGLTRKRAILGWEAGQVLRA
jgi:AraC family transcriptional regulator, regulatory protein of adaptative response / methylated-DNA-[protein]-cysteine methyltransferase